MSGEIGLSDDKLRYLHDPIFHHAVDSIRFMLRNGQLSHIEVKQAFDLAYDIETKLYQEIVSINESSNESEV